MVTKELTRFCTLGALALGVAVAFSAQNGAAQAPRSDARLAATAGPALVSSETLPDGVTVSTYSSSSAAITVAGGGVQNVQETDGASAADVTVDSPAVTKPTDTTVDGTTVTDVPASVPTAYQLSVDMGMPTLQAKTFAAGLDGSGPVASPVSDTTATASARRPYDAWCVNVSSKDHHETSHNCVIRYLDYARGSNWYLVNKMEGSGNSTDGGLFASKLTHLGLRMEYSSGNTTVSWQPDSTRTVGACHTEDTTATDPQTDMSFTTSETVCPDSLSPYAANSFR